MRVLHVSKCLIFASLLVFLLNNNVHAQQNVVSDHLEKESEHALFLNEDNKLDNRVSTRLLADTNTTDDSDDHEEEEEQECEHAETIYGFGDITFWIYFGLAALCVATAGLMSGLTVGLLSIDDLQLDIKMKTGTDEEKRHAAIIQPIIAHHHQLLSTLLITNALAMECLPIFLDAIVPAWAAVIISTFFVVVFGEIIPQAYCTGPSQLKIAAACGPMVTKLMWVLSPLCVPLAKCLDSYLGVHGKTRFVKNDLKALIELHQIQKSRQAGVRSGADSQHHHSSLTEEHIANTGLTIEETKLIISTIDLRDTPVTKEMIPIEKVFMVSSGAEITKELVTKVLHSGFSKIPVYKEGDKENVIGFLKAKSLLCYEKCLGQSVQQSGLTLTDPLFVSKDTSMLALLGLFQVKKTAIALITEDSIKKEKPDDIFFSKRDYVLENMGKKKLIGLISLKDIFEEMLESELKDDDIHNPVSLYSVDPASKKKNRGYTQHEVVEEVEEALEGKEKGLKKPLLDSKSKGKGKR